MIDNGIYLLNRALTMVDVEKGSMLRLGNADTIEIVQSLGQGKCLVKSRMGDFVAMEMTLKTLYLEGWLSQTGKNKVA